MLTGARCACGGIAHSADGRVQQALRKRRPECWAACGDQADNVTALCPVSCLFETMLGNHSAVPTLRRLAKRRILDTMMIQCPDCDFTYISFGRAGLGRLIPGI